MSADIVRTNVPAIRTITQAYGVPFFTAHRYVQILLLLYAKSQWEIVGNKEVARRIGECGCSNGAVPYLEGLYGLGLIKQNIGEASKEQSWCLTKKGETFAIGLHTTVNKH